MNNHLLIEPIEQNSFIASQRESYQEIGRVVAVPDTLNFIGLVDVDDKVFFDAWLAKKYPKEGTTDEYYWLVKWEDVTAVEYAEQKQVQELNLSE